MSFSGGCLVGLWFQSLSVPALAGLALIVAAGAVAGGLWVQLSRSYRRPLTIATVAAALLVVAFVPHMHNDAAEHLHAIWLMSRGHLPFRDFWEHHSPLLWIVLAPALRVLPSGVHLWDAARVLSVALAAVPLAFGLKWARRIGAAASDRSIVVGLWLASLLPNQFYVLRPDLPADALVFGALWTYLQPAAWLSSLATGCLMGLAIAFSPKHIFLVAVPPAVEYWRRRQPGRVGKWLVLYLVGILLGLSPLVGWLLAHGLLHAFWSHVYGVNTSDKVLALGGILPVLPTLLAGWWAWTRFRPGAEPQAPEERLLLAALVAALVLYFLQPGMVKYAYNLQMFWLLAMVAGVRPVRSLLDRLGSAGRPGLAGALVALYFLPSFLPVMAVCSGQLPSYPAGRATLARLIKVAGQGPVVGRGADHSVFSEDAVDLHMSWRWAHLGEPALRVGLKGLVDRIIARRPTVVVAYPWGRAVGGVAKYLADCKVISPRDAARLRAFLKANYRLVRIGDLYWVRDDRPVPAGSVVRMTAGGAGANQR